MKLLEDQVWDPPFFGRKRSMPASAAPSSAFSFLLGHTSRITTDDVNPGGSVGVPAK